MSLANTATPRNVPCSCAKGLDAETCPWSLHERALRWDPFSRHLWGCRTSSILPGALSSGSALPSILSHDKT